MFRVLRAASSHLFFFSLPPHPFFMPQKITIQFPQFPQLLAMHQSHTTVGPLRSWVHAPHHLSLSTPTPSRLCSITSSPPPSSLQKGLRATKKSVSFIRSPSPPSKSTRHPVNVGPPSSLKKGLRATKKSVSFLRSPSPTSSTTHTRTRFVLPGESSPRRSSYRLGDTTTFIPNHLDLTNISPTRRSAFFAALKVTQDLIDNPPGPSSTATSPVKTHLKQPLSPVVQLSPPAIQSPPPIVVQPPAHLPVVHPRSSPILQPSPAAVQSSPPVVAQPPPHSPILHRSPLPPRRSDFFAALKAVQDLIDNPPATLLKSPVLSHHLPSPFVVKSPSPRIQATSPIVARPIVNSPRRGAVLPQPTQPIRKVFIPAPRPVLRRVASAVLTDASKPSPPRKSLGDAWVDSRLAPKAEFVTPGEDRKDRIRVLKWAADLPSPVVDTEPRPTALQELPISPLSSAFFRSSMGAPSPLSSPSPRSVSLPSSASRFACSSGSSTNTPSTPPRPSGFFDWWFDSLSPIIISHVTSAPPRFLENPSPVASSFFRSSLGAPEESPLQVSATPRPASQSPTKSPLPSPPRLSLRSASLYLALPCSHTPSPVVQTRLNRPSVAGLEFSPPLRGLCHLGKLAAPSSDHLCAYLPTATSSPSPSLGLPWKSIAGIVGIAAGAFTLGCLATKYLF